MAYKFLADQRKAQREWYARNKENDRLKKRKRRADIKKWFTVYRQGMSCSRCPENHPACLDFHHVDPTSKYRNVGVLVRDGSALSTLQREIEKCIPLCSNCHRKEHYK